MENLIRCKACGLIMSEKEAAKADKCPACGVPKTAFEPYKETMSARRKMILELHLHPIALHFPQASSALLPVLILGGIIASTFSSYLYTTALVLAILLPFTVIATFVSGVIDGKARFKKLTTPFLIKKMTLGSIFFLLSCFIAYLVIALGIENSKIYILAISFFCIVCEVMLSQIGVRLVYAKLPGS